MKKVFLLLSLLTAIMAGAENLFVEGANWTYYSEPMPGDGDPATFEYYLAAPQSVGDYECLTLYKEDARLDPAKSVLGVIRTEGDKVYYQTKPGVDEWRLMYDFGLQPGDEAELWSLTFDWEAGDADKAAMYKVKCTEIGTAENYGNWPTMTLESADDGNYSSEWLNGIGCLGELEYVMPGAWAGATWTPVLVRFEVNGVEKCVLKLWNGIESISDAENAMSVSVNGNTVSICGITDSSVNIYDTLGRLAGTYAATDGTCSIKLSTGLWLVGNGTAFRKVAVR